MTHNAADNNSQLPQAGNEMATHSEFSAAGRSVKDNHLEDVDLSKHLTKQQWKEDALNPSMMSTIWT